MPPFVWGIKIILFRGLIFPEIVFFLKKNGNTGGTGLKSRSENMSFLSCTDRRFFVLYNQKICLVQTEHSAQKKVPKSQISLELFLCIVKTESRALLKN